MDVAKKVELVGNARSSEGVGEAAKSGVRGVEGGRRSPETGKELAGVDLDEANEKVGTGGKENLPDDVVGQSLRSDCLESEDGLFANGCGHGVNEGGGCEGEFWEARWKKVLLE